jgi:hypothetical protein
MKKYTEQQIKKLQSKMYTAVANGTPTYIKAYLKENALIAFQKIDPSISENDINISSLISSHSTSVDEIQEDGIEYVNGIPQSRYKIAIKK